MSITQLGFDMKDGSRVAIRISAVFHVGKHENTIDLIETDKGTYRFGLAPALVPDISQLDHIRIDRTEIPLTRALVLVFMDGTEKRLPIMAVRHANTTHKMFGLAAPVCPPGLVSGYSLVFSPTIVPDMRQVARLTLIRS